MNKTRGHPAKVVVMSNVLVLPNISMEDKGTYHCQAEIEPKRINATVKVIVYGEYAFKLLHYCGDTITLIIKFISFIL